MAILRAEAVAWVDDGFPGWVEVRFTDARGRLWTLVDKAPAFDAPEGLGPDSTFPLEVGIVCVPHERSATADDEIVTVSTAVHGVAALDGEDVFCVRRNQLIL